MLYVVLCVTIKQEISKMEKFIILSRYEHWDKNNKKTWCKWFVVDSKPKT